MSTNGALVEVDHLKQYFPIKEGIVFQREVARVHAVDDVTFHLREGETLGLVGESGCGKTTLARTIVRLLEPTDGVIRFRGNDISHAGRRDLRPMRGEMQIVFQDPYASLNPRKRVGQIIGTPLALHAEELYQKPIHPYTSALLGAIPIPDPEENRQRERITLEGEPPSAIDPPPACRFHPRCPRATEICRTIEPPLAEYAGGHVAACHHPLSVTREEIAGAVKSDLSPRSAGDELPDPADAAA